MGQQGTRKGYYPKRPGRTRHHLLLAVLAEAHHVVHGWLRSGNRSSERGVVEFLQEAFALFDAGGVGGGIRPLWRYSTTDSIPYFSRENGMVSMPQSNFALVSMFRQTSFNHLVLLN